MEYSAEFEADLRELEYTAKHLGFCRQVGQIDPAEERRVDVDIDHILNTYPVPAPAILGYTNRVIDVYTNHEQSRASKIVATEREILFKDLCDDYDPVF